MPATDPLELAPPAGEGPGARVRRAALLVRRPSVAVAAVAAAVYAGTLRGLPVLDDFWAVLDNPLVRTLDVRRIFGAEYNTGGSATNAGLFRPIPTLTWALDYALHGRAPLGYHLVNVALHAAATVLVLLLARRLLSAVAPAHAATGALAAALLFAVHPAHVEAVAPMVARADLLAAAGGLGALVLALGAASPRRLAAAWGLLALAMLSKESASVVPILYALVAALVPAAAGLAARPGVSTSEGRRALLRAAGVAALLASAAIPYVALRPTAVGIPVAAQWFGGRPASVVWNTMTRAVAEYLRILVFPARLMTDFGYAARIPFTTAFGAASAAATAIWAAVLVAGVLAARRAPLVALAVLWTFAALLPVLNLVRIGALMAERFLYLPSVGVCLVAGLAAAELAARLGPSAQRAALASGVAALALLAGRTAARAADWRTPLALWSAEVRSAPLDPVVNNNLAVEYNARRQWALARERLEVALDVAPGYWRARVNLGITLHHLGEDEAALGELRAAIAVAPREASPRFFLAVVLEERGELDRAVEALETAERLAPEDPRILVHAGKDLLALGRVAEARAKLERATALDPRDGEARRLLAALP